MMEGMPWGTWEVFVLCGAVLRHGTTDWVAVAAELRPRTPYSHVVDPEVCKAKFEELQNHFSSFNSLFDELRKCRIAELKSELEQSENSIGSLHSKIEHLSAEKENRSGLVYNRHHSPSVPRYGSVDGKEAFSSDRSCAGSFTQDIREEWSSKPRILTSLVSDDEGCIEHLDDVQRVEVIKFSYPWQGWGKKQRRTRKRKADSHIKERNASEICTRASVKADSEESKGQCNQKTDVFLEDSGSSGIVNVDDCSNMELMAILDSILDNEGVMVFQQRLEGQKKARYNKMIRQHVDFHSIRYRIVNGLITSMQELLRDLLLLSNNALIFFPMDSHEHSAAVLLRELAMDLLENVQHSKNCPMIRSSLVPPGNGTVKARLPVSRKPAGQALRDAENSNCTKTRKRQRHPTKSAPVKAGKGRKRVKAL